MTNRLKILVVHGPNLNLLGKRDPSKYGTITMQQVNDHIQQMADEMSVDVVFFQSNHEGSFIDFFQEDDSRASDGVLINPGALIRYAYAFRQSLVDLNKPVMEIHMSDIHKTGVNQGVNVLDGVRVGQVTGLKEESYYQGFKELVEHIKRVYSI